MDKGFGELLTELRKEKHVSKAELARRINSTHDVIWKIEAGRVTPKLGTAEKLLKALGYEFKIVPNGEQKFPIWSHSK